MSAVLRVYGCSLDIDDVLKRTQWTLCSVQRCGERRFPDSSKNDELFSINAIFVDMSAADLSDLGRQIEDVIQFLSLHADQVESLIASEGVEEAVIDFGIAKRDHVAQVDVFPAALVRSAGKLGLGLSLSQYAFSASE